MDIDFELYGLPVPYFGLPMCSRKYSKNAFIKIASDYPFFPDNKELRLKMDFILEENERLKAIIQSIESQQLQQQQQQ